MHQQVAGYVSGTALGRGPEELNRLRTLALAVVNVTQFNLVAQADEDRAYFAKFAAASDIDTHHRLIQDACELLHNVQLAQRQHEDARRQKLLNAVVLLLTSLTLVSVTVDGYSFIAGDASVISNGSGSSNQPRACVRRFGRSRTGATVRSKAAGVELDAGGSEFVPSPQLDFRVA